MGRADLGWLVDLPLPTMKYILLHAALAKVLRDSDMGRWVDGTLREVSALLKKSNLEAYDLAQVGAHGRVSVRWVAFRLVGVKFTRYRAGEWRGFCAGYAS